jgi:hypothetical protein
MFKVLWIVATRLDRKVQFSCSLYFVILFNIFALSTVYAKRLDTNGFGLRSIHTFIYLESRGLSNNCLYGGYSTFTLSYKTIIYMIEGIRHICVPYTYK